MQDVILLLQLGSHAAREDGRMTAQGLSHFRWPFLAHGCLIKATARGGQQEQWRLALWSLVTGDS
jgi:hypothetical protein